MFKVNSPVIFEVKFYSLTGGPLTGATVLVNLYNPANAAKVSGGSAVELTAGRYTYTYTPDAVGRWVADFSTTHADADLIALSQSVQVVDAGTLAVNYYIALGKEIA